MGKTPITTRQRLGMRESYGDGVYYMHYDEDGNIASWWRGDRFSPIFTHEPIERDEAIEMFGQDKVEAQEFKTAEFCGHALTGTIIDQDWFTLKILAEILDHLAFVREHGMEPDAYHAQRRQAQQEAEAEHQAERVARERAAMANHPADPAVLALLREMAAQPPS